MSWNHCLKGIVRPKMRIVQPLAFLTPMLMESRVKFCLQQNISAKTTTTKNSIEAFSKTSEVDGVFLQKKRKKKN